MTPATEQDSLLRIVDDLAMLPEELEVVRSAAYGIWAENRSEAAAGIARQVKELAGEVREIRERLNAIRIEQLPEDHPVRQRHEAEGGAP